MANTYILRYSHVAKATSLKVSFATFQNKKKWLRYDNHVSKRLKDVQKSAFFHFISFAFEMKENSTQDLLESHDEFLSRKQEP